MSSRELDVCVKPAGFEIETLRPCMIECAVLSVAKYYRLVLMNSYAQQRQISEMLNDTQVESAFTCAVSSALSQPITNTSNRYGVTGSLLYQWANATSGMTAPQMANVMSKIYPEIGLVMSDLIWSIVVDEYSKTPQLLFSTAAAANTIAMCIERIRAAVLISCYIPPMENVKNTMVPLGNISVYIETAAANAINAGVAAQCVNDFKTMILGLLQREALTNQTQHIKITDWINSINTITSSYKSNAAGLIASQQVYPYIQQICQQEEILHSGLDSSIETLWTSVKDKSVIHSKSNTAQQSMIYAQQPIAPQMVSAPMAPQYVYYG